MPAYTWWITLEAQDENGQYNWSIMIGLVTLFMTMFVNVMLVAALLPGELAQVLIRIPFVVPEMVQSLTTSPLTSPSFGYFPKLPTLKLELHTLVNLMELKDARHSTIREFECKYIPDAMTRSTSNASYGDLRVPLSNWNAVITSSYVWWREVDTGASFDVDSISIRTSIWGLNLEFTTFEVVTFYKSYMKELAIHRSYASDHCLVHCNKFQALSRKLRTWFPVT